MSDMEQKIILASASPRRKDILSLLGLKFEVRPAEIDETLEKGLSVGAAIEDLSRRKAEKAALAGSGNELIIAADTVVCIDGKILGKPSDEQDAFNMLSLLSGRVHCVYTAVTLLSANASRTFCEKTDVEFFPLSEAEIFAYIETKEPFDKAGAYGIQGKGALLVRRICGDFFNVVGLPVARLQREIRNLNGGN